MIQDAKPSVLRVTLAVTCGLMLAACIAVVAGGFEGSKTGDSSAGAQERNSARTKKATREVQSAIAGAVKAIEKKDLAISFSTVHKGLRDAEHDQNKTPRLYAD